MFKKHSIYVFIGLIIAALLLLTFNYVLITCFKPKYIPAEYWIPEVLIKKDIISKKIKNNKIIIVSGSNALFGVSSLTLQERTGKDVLNLATHAGVPIDFLLSIAKEYATAGDIVIMPLEYGYLYRESSPSQWEVEQFTTWGRNYLDSFSMYKKSLILAKSAKFLANRIINMAKPIPVRSRAALQLMNNNKIISEKAYDTASLNIFCEFFIDAPPQPHMLEMKNSGVEYDIPEALSDDFVEKMTNATKDFEKKDITLFVTYPVSIKNKLFDTDNAEHIEKIQKIYDKISRSGIKTFGNAHKYNIDVSNFYDTTYHLNAKGATLRTLFLADDLLDMLAGADIPQRPSVDYFNAKNKDAVRILNGYRQRDNVLNQ